MKPLPIRDEPPIYETIFLVANTSRKNMTNTESVLVHHRSDLR